MGPFSKWVVGKTKCFSNTQNGNKIVCAVIGRILVTVLEEFACVDSEVAEHRRRKIRLWLRLRLRVDSVLYLTHSLTASLIQL